MRVFSRLLIFCRASSQRLTCGKKGLARIGLVDGTIWINLVWPRWENIYQVYSWYPRHSHEEWQGYNGWWSRIYRKTLIVIKNIKKIDRWYHGNENHIIFNISFCLQPGYSVTTSPSPPNHSFYGICLAPRSYRYGINLQNITHLIIVTFLFLP